MTIGCEAIKLASISASQGNLSATAKRCKMPRPPPDSAPALLLSSRSTYFRIHFTARSLLDGRCFKQIGQTYQTFCQMKTSGAQRKHGNNMSLLGSHTATSFCSKTVHLGPPATLFHHCGTNSKHLWPGAATLHPIAKVNAFTRGMLVSNGTLRIQEVREVSAK